MVKSKSKLKKVGAEIYEMNLPKKLNFHMWFTYFNIYSKMANGGVHGS